MSQSRSHENELFHHLLVKMLPAFNIKHLIYCLLQSDFLINAEVVVQKQSLGFYLDNAGKDENYYYYFLLNLILRKLLPIYEAHVGERAQLL